MLSPSNSDKATEDRKWSGRPWELDKKDETSKDNLPKKQKKNVLGYCCRTHSNVWETSTLIRNCLNGQKKTTYLCKGNKAKASELV